MRGSPVMASAGLLLAAAVALIPGEGRRRLGAAGLGALTLALAAERLAPAAGAPAGYAAVTVGLLLVGWLVPAAAVLAASRRDGRSALPALLAAVGAATLGVPPALRLVREVGAGASWGVAAALLALGLLGSATVGRLRPGAAIRRRERVSSAPSAPIPLGLTVGATLLAAAGNHVTVVLLAAAAGGWAAWLATAPAGRPWPVGAIAATLLVAPSLVLLTAVSGPEGLGLAAIPWLPISPAAERLLGLLLFGAVLALGGLWPLRQPLDGLLTAPLGALLLIRVALPAVPDGLAHWRAAAFPLVVLGLWHAAVTRRTAALAVGGALLGLSSLQPSGVEGAGWLLASAVGAGLAAGRTAAALPRLVLALAGYWGALQVIGAGLATEAVYTLAAVLAATLGLAARPDAGALSDSRTALTPPPVGSIFGRETI